MPRLHTIKILSPSLLVCVYNVQRGWGWGVGSGGNYGNKYKIYFRNISIPWKYNVKAISSYIQKCESFIYFLKTKLCRELKAIYEEISRTKAKVSCTKLFTCLGPILRNMAPRSSMDREQSVVTHLNREVLEFSPAHDITQ